MSDYYTPAGNPAASSSVTSANVRAEFALVDAAFNKFPSLSANPSAILQINGAGTAVGVLTAINSLPIGNVTPSTGAFTTLSATGILTLTAATEAVRIKANGGLITGYNATNTLRTGYIQYNTGASVVYAAENGAIPVWYVGGTERMRIDTAGNIGVGIAASAWANGLKVIELGQAGCAFGGLPNAGTYVANNLFANGVNWTRVRLDGTSIYVQVSGTHLWYTAGSGAAGGTHAPAENMRLESNGKWMLGTSLAASPAAGLVGDPAGTFTIANNAQGNGFPFMLFLRSTAQIGSVSQSGTTAVLYNTTSDRRLKKNIKRASEVGHLIDAIKVRSFDWRESGEHVSHGFIAQELVEIAPQAVKVGTTKKDPWGVDPSKLVALLVQEIQSLRQRVEELENRTSHGR